MNKLQYPITYINKDYYTIEEILRDSYEIYKHNNDCKKQIGDYRGHKIYLDLVMDLKGSGSLFEFVKYQINVIDKSKC